MEGSCHQKLDQPLGPWKRWPAHEFLKRYKTKRLPELQAIPLVLLGRLVLLALVVQQNPECRECLPAWEALSSTDYMALPVT